jgi:glutamyl-Q tRNA(Asp) synthetase
VKHSEYRGRFAPSPTGPLHFGSLVAAVGSYLEAKKHNGTWLVRMEDLDAPRTVEGAASSILHTLEAFRLHWDGPILYQSERSDAYEGALNQLRQSGAAYPCACTRREIADSALHGIDGLIYPGTCRPGVTEGKHARTWRVRTENDPVEFDDALQGRIVQHLESEIGDFVVRRADGLFAYQLAVVVDDGYQHISHVVRGADLLLSTPRQIWLQRLLGLPTPSYMHLPVAVNAQGEKLSKQTLAAAVDAQDTSGTLWQVLQFLRQQPPEELRRETLPILWQWALANWNAARLNGVRTLPAPL